MPLTKIRCSYPKCGAEPKRGEKWIAIVGKEGPIYFCPVHEVHIGKIEGKVEPVEILNFAQIYEKEEPDEKPGCFKDYGFDMKLCDGCGYAGECKGTITPEEETVEGVAIIDGVATKVRVKEGEPKLTFTIPPEE